MITASETQATTSVIFSKSKMPPLAYGQIGKLVQKSIEEVSFKLDAELEDFFQVIQDQSHSVFVFNLFDRAELSALLSFLPQVRSAIKDKRVIVIAFLKVPNPKVEEILVKSGVHEILKYDTSAKGFLYKLKRYLMHVRASDLSAGDDLNVKELISGRAQANPRGQDLGSSPAKRVSAYHKKGGQVVIVDAIGVSSDFWLFRKKVYAKKFKEQWLVELIGPSSAAGKWQKTMDFNHLFPGQKNVWKWVLREPGSRFAINFDPKPAVWVFVGNQPEYNWSINRWGFISASPVLALVNAEEILASRFKANDDQDLLMGDNSQIALDYFDRIKETFDKDYYLQLEAKESKDHLLMDEALADIPWADKLSTKEVAARDWEEHDLTQDDGLDWNDQSASDRDSHDASDFTDVADEIENRELGLRQEHEKPNKQIEKTLQEVALEMDLPLGSEAMQDCGMHAILKTVNVELIGYSEADKTILLGVPQDLVQAKEIIDVEINSENMKAESKIILKGIVSELEPSEEGRFIIKALINSDSQNKIRKIREAIEQRQEEVLLFFKKAKGY